MADIAYKKLFGIGTAFIMSLPGWCAGSYLSTSPTSVGYLVTVFSILAASLFAVISIVGDPSMLLSGNRRVAWRSARSLQRRLQTYNHLFTSYLMTLGLVIVASFLKDAKSDLTIYVFSLVGVLSLFCFLCSLTVPYSLARLQRSRMEGEIKDRGAE